MSAPRIIFDPIWAGSRGVVLLKGKPRSRAIDVLAEHHQEMQARRDLHLQIGRNWHVVTNPAGTAYAVLMRDAFDTVVLQLELLLVLPHARRNGVGSRLLRALAEVYGPISGECHTPSQVAFYTQAGCAVRRIGKFGSHSRVSLAPLVPQAAVRCVGVTA